MKPLSHFMYIWGVWVVDLINPSKSTSFCKNILDITTLKFIDKKPSK